MVQKPGKAVRRVIVGGVSTAFLLSVLSMVQVDASNPLDNIEIISVGGSEQYTPIEETVNKVILNSPVTWGEFISKAKIREGEPIVKEESLEFIVKYNKGKSPLIMTKTEVFDAFKVLLELNSRNKITKASDFRLMTLIYSLAPNRNYLMTRELDNLFYRFDNLEVHNGALRERALGRINKLEGNNLVVDILPQDLISEPTKEVFRLSPGMPWKHTSGIYDILLEGDIIISLVPKYEVKFGLVESQNGYLTVDNNTLKEGAKATSGDFVEYITTDNTPYIFNNYGKQVKSYIVRGVDRRGVYTLGGEDLDRDTVFMNVSGNVIDPRTLGTYTVVARLNDDTALVIDSTDEHEISYVPKGGYLYLDGVLHSEEDVWVTDGTKVYKVKNFKYLEYVNKAKVSKDLLGKPKLITIDKLEHIVAIESIDSKGNIKGIGEQGEVTLNQSWYQDLNRLRRGEVYNLVIVDDEVVDYERLQSKFIRTDELDESYISYGGRRSDRLYVDEDITVIVEGEDTTGKDNQKNRTIKYSELLKEYREKIKNGDMAMDVYYDGDVALMIKVRYNPVEGMTKDNRLDNTPLSLYTLESFNISGDIYSFTLSDGKNKVTFTDEGSRHWKDSLSGINSGDKVVARFNSKGNITDIRKFELTEDLLTTRGLSGYLKLTEMSMPTLGYTNKNKDFIALRETYTFYEDDKGTLVTIPKDVEVHSGTFYIYREGNLVRITLLPEKED